MSFFSELLAGGASGLASGLGSFAKDLREAITGKSILDPNKTAEILQQAQALEAAAVQAAADYDRTQMEGQVAVQKLEAASVDPFVTRWRPSVGWVCVAGLFYTFILKPLLPWVFQVGALAVGQKSVVPLLPEVPMGDLIVLLTGMLGLGTMRSVEKIKGVGK
jgi:Protein of unknown function (DUF3154).